MTLTPRGKMPIEPGDAQGLARALVAVDSRNPSLVRGAPGEGRVAQLLAEVLEGWGLSVELQEVLPGRPNVVARAGAARSGARTLLFNGHLDVVDASGMRHPPFAAQIAGNRLFGRGAADMKGGVAAMCAAAWRAAKTGIAGQVVVAAVVDEEFESAGTAALLASGVRADAAVVTEPTQLAVGPAHKGFAWIEVDVVGRAAHGSRYDLGIDANSNAALLISELKRFESEVLSQRTHPLLGRASLHVSEIHGGVGWSTYAPRCVMRLERRTVPGEDSQAAVAEVQAVCEELRRRHPDFLAEPRQVFAQQPSDIPRDAAIVRALCGALAAERLPERIEGVSAWTDAALIAAAGIPAVCFGPGDMSLAHGAEEWVSLEEIESAARVLARLAAEWCR